jgi:hypothetical protein
MLALVHLNADALADPPSMALLTVMARRHRLVVVCAQCGSAMGVLRALREIIPRHRVVTLLVEGEVAVQERRLIRQLLDEGQVPLVLSTARPPQARLVNWVWLRPGVILVLP